MKPVSQAGILFDTEFRSNCGLVSGSRGWNWGQVKQAKWLVGMRRSGSLCCSDLAVALGLLLQPLMNAYACADRCALAQLCIHLATSTQVKTNLPDAADSGFILF